MSNKLLLMVISASLLVGGVIGFAIKAALTPQTKVYTPEIKTELVIKKVPVRVVETKYLDKLKVKTDTIFKIPEFTITDSLKGNKDSIEFKVIHSIDNNYDSVKSRWNISVNSLLKEFIKEKLIVELKEIPVSKPFFTDGWFWSSFVAISLLVLSIIF